MPVKSNTRKKRIAEWVVLATAIVGLATATIKYLHASGSTQNPSALPVPSTPQVNVITSISPSQGSAASPTQSSEIKPNTPQQKADITLPPRQETINSPGAIQIGQASGNVTINNQVYQLEKPAQVKSPIEIPPTANETDYKRIASPALYANYLDKTVTVRAVYLSEWTDINIYKMINIDTNNKIFINHRSADYVSAETGLGSSDLNFPPFVMSVDASLSDQIFKIKRGEIILVTGKISAIKFPQRMRMTGLEDCARFIMEVTEIKLLK